MNVSVGHEARLFYAELYAYELGLPPLFCILVLDAYLGGQLGQMDTP